VKNVAGYDLCKLLVGSLGTLGVITQVTLKLRPITEQRAIVRLACTSDNVEAMLASLHESRTRPACIELLNRGAADAVFAHAQLGAFDAPWLIVVGYDGNADAVSWQVQQFVKEVGARCRLEARVDFPADALCHAVVESAAWAAGAVVFKASLLASAVAGFCQAVDGEPDRPQVRSHAGNGIVFGCWPAGLTKERAATMLTLWRDRARQGQGSVVVLQCPSDWKTTVDVWGPAPEAAALMREVKKQFDPKRIFNPGRFLDGI
ncbi:MAG: FAD-binding oxidoreductase, partial [Planctomycetes bacterium]|nr:FAD-binding oxidoreductase [Planctomycetota bacterium]